MVADEAWGDTPGFLAGVAGVGWWYCAEVPHTTRVWGERPATHVPPQWERLGEGAPEARNGGGGGGRTAR